LNSRMTICMLIVARSRPEINLKESIGQHEFTSSLERCSQ